MSLLGVALPKTKTIMNLKVFALDDLADRSIDYLIPAIDQFGLD